MDVTVSIIIVTYNCRNDIVDCLQSVIDQTSAVAYEVIVLDNASSDGTAAVVASRFPQVRLIENRGNVGFGKGNNIAAAAAKGQFLLLLNPDTVIRSNAIDRLADFAARFPEAGAWGGICELPDGRVDPGCRQQIPSIRQRLKLCVVAGARLDRNIDRSPSFSGKVPVLSGAFMMLPRSVWHRLGGFDETFKLYSEETDLCFRIHQMGRDIMLTGQVRILHNTGSGNPYAPARAINLTRGIMQFFRKHRSVPTAFCAGILIWVHGLSRLIGAAVFPRRTGNATAASIKRRSLAVIRRPSRWWRGWEGQSIARSR